MIDYKEQLAESIKSIREQRLRIKNELSKFDDDKLGLSFDDKRLIMYEISNINGRYCRRKINKDKKRIKTLARKAYLSALDKVLVKDMEVLKDAYGRLSDPGIEALKSYLPRNFSALSPEIYLLNNRVYSKAVSLPNPVRTDDIKPVLPSLYINDISPDEWFRMPYKENIKYAENKKILLPNGLHVRSKSEASIIDIVEKHRWPYHYDEVINLGGEWLSPDLILLREDGKVFYLEHCGLMDKAEYVSDHYKKLSLYRQFGIVPWDNLIVSYDEPSGGLNLKLIEIILESKMNI